MAPESTHRTPQRGQGGFDWAEWTQLRRIIEAGLTADAGRFKTELHSLDRAFPMSGRPGAYLWFALRYQLAKKARRKPTSADLSSIAKQAFPSYHQLVTVDPEMLEHLFHVVFGLRPRANTSTGAHLIVNGAAALSAVLDDETDLDEIQEHLVPWYTEHGAEFVALDPLGT